MNPPNLLKLCLKMWNFLTSVFSPEHCSGISNAGTPPRPWSDPEALPLLMGTRWIWRTKQARPGLHSAAQRPRQAFVSGSWAMPAVIQAEATRMPCLTERGPFMPAAWRLLRETVCRGSVLVPRTSPSRLATWEPDGAQETERELSVSQSRFLFFLSPLRPPCTLFRQRGPSPFQQRPCSCLRLLLLPAQSWQLSSGRPPLGSTPPLPLHPDGALLAPSPRAPWKHPHTLLKSPTSNRPAVL